MIIIDVTLIAYFCTYLQKSIFIKVHLQQLKLRR